jgi:Ca2+-binding RTX toxin-like protein
MALIRGTKYADRWLWGDVYDDQIYGAAGDDELEGSDGNDFLHGGSGNDRVSAGSGYDISKGGTGNDQIRDWDGGAVYGGKGNDWVSAGSGYLDGGPGQDVVSATAYPGVNVIVVGGKGHDSFNIDGALNYTGPISIILADRQANENVELRFKVTDRTEEVEWTDITAFDTDHNGLINVADGLEHRPGALTLGSVFLYGIAELHPQDFL